MVGVVTLDTEARFSLKCGCTAVALMFTEIRLRESPGLNTKSGVHHNNEIRVFKQSALLL